MDEIMEDKVPKEVNEYCKTFLDKLVTGNIDYCFNQMDSQFQDDDTRKFFVDSYRNLKDKELIKSAIIDSRYTIVYGENAVTNYELSYEYKYDNLWVYYTFRLQKKDDQLSLYGFKITPVGNSLRQLHEFSFKNKGFKHYFFFLMLLVVPLFILISIGFSIKTPLKQKWLWIIFMLLGFISFKLNWTDGQLAIQPISFKILGAGFSKTGIVAPWIFSFAIPFGAILFWFKRAKVRRQTQIQETSEKQELEKNENAP